jgi:hypothetical protein
MTLIKSGKDIMGSHEPVCPYCYVPIINSSILPYYEDGDTDEITCVACNKAYWIRARKVLRFDCSPKEKK